MNKKEKIDYDCNKEVMVETKMKKKKNKAEIGEKKKRRADADLEDLMQEDDNDKILSKKFGEKLDIDDKESEDSEEFVSDSDMDEEVMIDEDHDDDSEEYIEEEMKEDNNTGEKNVKVNIWDENTKLKGDQELDFDNEAYEMLHRSKVEWPCMTLDFIIPQTFDTPINSLYEKKEFDFKSLDQYPYSCYMVAGSQTTSANGYLYYMKWYNMHKTMYDDDPDKGADSDEEEGQEPFMKFDKMQVKGNINKIKAMKNSYLAAYWTDSPSIEIVNMKELFSDMDHNILQGKNKKRKTNNQSAVVKTFARKNEGFAIEWSSLIPGVLAAGGLDKTLEIYLPTDESYSDWVLNSSNSNGITGVLKGHKAPIEDVIWSPFQQHVAATCSSDKSIRFWDLRSDKNNPPIILEKAHDSDVNCISWNNHVDFMIASGGEDCAFKVWDIRYLSNGPITNILWHKGAISSLSWDPFEDSQLAVASEDNRLSIWDFAVEPDDNHLFDSTNKEVPHQLVFLHQGQENIKDLKFHPIFKNFIASTAENGINVFKPAFDDEGSSIDTEEMMDVDN